MPITEVVIAIMAIFFMKRHKISVH